jgi:hypothetical protein
MSAAWRGLIARLLMRPKLRSGGCEAESMAGF